MEGNSTALALEAILKMHMGEVNAELMRLQEEEPGVYLEGRKLKHGVLEWHNSLLYRLMVGTPDFTDEQSRKVHIACARHLRGEINLAGYLQ